MCKTAWKAGSVTLLDVRWLALDRAPFKGRNTPHRGDRKWGTGWSPEQIARRLQIDFPNDASMRISHEAIYQALYMQGRGALKREWVSGLCTGRALRVPRASAQAKAWAHVSEAVMISISPAEAQDHAVSGHWEGDLIIGLTRSAIGTLAGGASKLVHLPREKGYGLIPRTKNGPTLAGYGAITMANALRRTVTTLPAQLWQSLTWDRGKELSDHARFTAEAGVKVFFAAPHSPWQRGTNENTNRLLRQYFPKGTALSRWSDQEIQVVAHTLNTRLRKTLGWKTPAEALNKYLQFAGQPSVASTG
jgi:IS30 family transposase